MKHYRKLQLVAAAILVSGIVLLVPFAYFWSQNKIALAKASQNVASAVASVPASIPEPTPTLITGSPKTLEIPSLNLNLQIVDGEFNAKTSTWTLSRDKAHYALPTIQPNNEQGNTLIYGHYRKEVFARLHLIKEGAEASVTTDNGYRFVYMYKNAQAVEPSDTSIFAYEGKPQLTIQTCSGTWMQNRQLYFFAFDRVEKL
jgi:LPXTG-site transpeptidase (sortase) family protein